MIFDHQKNGYIHLICADIYNIGRDMIQSRNFDNGGTFCPSLPFLENFDESIPTISDFKMLFDHENLGIDTYYDEISVILATYDTKYHFR